MEYDTEERRKKSEGLKNERDWGERKGIKGAWESSEEGKQSD